MLGLLACSEEYEFGQLGTAGFLGSGNILFVPNADEFFFLRTNGIPERRS